MKTHDIIAEFASSIDKTTHEFIPYRAVLGSVFNDEYSETLDSATILIDHVPLSKRLYNLSMYQFVRIHDAKQQSNFDHVYLIDTFFEKESNIYEHIFTYTIGLMSETKLLEKFQCPNVSIMHKVKNGHMQKLTIYEHIKRFVQLFVPKIKFIEEDNNAESWSYQPLIKVPGKGTDFYNKFNVPCADLGSSALTLRQLLTLLMNQVGCIPTVKNRTLGFLDFKVPLQRFGGNKGFYVNNTVNNISRSLSSDSFANSIVKISSNVLDSNNKVISETLGFRDKESVLLKQTQNLFLETKFPIYKVEKFIMNATGLFTFSWPFNQILWEKTQNGNVSVTFYITAYHPVDMMVYFYKTLATNGEKTLLGQVRFILGDTGIGQISVPDAYKDDVDSLVFMGTVGQYTERPGTPSGEITYSPIWGFSGTCRWTVDITPLIVESSIRSNLERDYKKMAEELEQSSIETLSKYVYGTVGYSIGNTRIEGFSETYSAVVNRYIFGSTNITYTYIENIFNIVSQNESKFSSYLTFLDYIKISNSETLLNFWQDNEYDLTNSLQVTAKAGTATVPTFAILTFDIEYQPLNSFNMLFEKQTEPIDFPIMQYNGEESGLADFDRMVAREQDIANRVGNVVLNISQRTDNIDDIQSIPTYFLDDINRDKDYLDEGEDTKYTIFKRSFSIGPYVYNASYTGSKDAILQNFFTSIRTKYRAFQYINYTQSTLRKERDVIYVRIGTDWYDGDDKIRFGNFESPHTMQMAKFFLTGASPVDENDTLPTFKYVCERSLNDKKQNEIVKNDISVVDYDNGFAIIYENFDNVGAGPYIANPRYETYYDDNDDDDDKRLGGIPQTWQIWDEDTYNQKHNVFFVNNLNFYNHVFVSEETDTEIVDLEAVYAIAAKSPIVTDILDPNTSDYVIMSIVDNNKNDSQIERTFYKDYAERINHTVQFVYYAPDLDVKWTSIFTAGNGFINRREKNEQFYIVELPINNLESFKNLNLNKEDHNESTVLSNFNDFVTISDGESSETNPYIQINWDNTRCVKIVKKVERYEDSKDVSDILTYSNGKTICSIVKNQLIGTALEQANIKTEIFLKVGVPFNKLVAIQNNQAVTLDSTTGEITWETLGDYVQYIDYIEFSYSYSVYKYLDVIAFFNTSDNNYPTRFYVSLNDSKSDYVMSERNGVLFRKYKTQSGNGRLVRNIESD